MSFEEKQQAGRLSTSKQRDNADKSMVAERQEPEGNGENDELAFPAAHLTMQYMDTIIPRYHVNNLHDVGRNV